MIDFEYGSLTFFSTWCSSVGCCPHLFSSRYILHDNRKIIVNRIESKSHDSLLDKNQVILGWFESSRLVGRLSMCVHVSWDACNNDSSKTVLPHWNSADESSFQIHALLLCCTSQSALYLGHA